MTIYDQLFSIIFILIFSTQFNLDRWADAVYLAEGGTKAKYAYGIRSIPYKDEAEARRICKNTIYNTLIKYREQRCFDGEIDLDCLGRRYAPFDKENWVRNVHYILEKEGSDIK